ncbi:MAG: tol-pal system-associated acyl-CoA thioesterase [Paracoccaceae bacterium]
MTENTPHLFPVRVYYEDTDMAGIVYYANYLRFIERARSDWVRSIGIDQNKMKLMDGLVFAVRRVEADYVAPAHFDDELTIETQTQSAGAARLILQQDIRRGTDIIFSAIVTIVCISERGKPARLPTNIRTSLG